MGDDLDFYSGGTQFESQPDFWLSSLKFLIIFPSLPKRTPKLCIDMGSRPAMSTGGLHFLSCLTKIDPSVNSQNISAYCGFGHTLSASPPLL